MHTQPHTVASIDATELARLKKLTKEWTTTLEQDEALLKKGFKDWREETLVRFRVLRKRALSRAIKIAQENLSEL